MCRSKDHSQGIQHHQGRVKQIQVKHTGSKAIVKIPQRKISFTKMIDYGCIMHGVLLQGISPYIAEHQQLISENVISVNDQAADKQYQQEQKSCLLLPAYFIYKFFHII